MDDQCNDMKLQQKVFAEHSGNAYVQRSKVSGRSPTPALAVTIILRYYYRTTSTQSIASLQIRCGTECRVLRALVTTAQVLLKPNKMFLY